MIKNYDKMIYHILKKNNLLHRADNLLDIGYIGVAKGMNKFDASRGTKLETYLYRCAYNEIMTELRRENAKKRDIKKVEFNDEFITDIDADIEGIINKSDEYEELYKQLFKLPIYEQYVLYQIYFNNKTQGEIARHLCMKQPDISNFKSSGLETMRENIKMR